MIVIQRWWLFFGETLLPRYHQVVVSVIESPKWKSPASGASHKAEDYLPKSFL
jgi:hypothetical protein